MRLTAVILNRNLLLRRPIIDSVLFALAIAVGITPQLLPRSSAPASRRARGRLATLKALVKPTGARCHEKAVRCTDIGQLLSVVSKGPVSCSWRTV
jgi:hypothetical protein